MGTSLGTDIVQRPNRTEKLYSNGVRLKEEERLCGCGRLVAKAALRNDDVVQINECRDGS